MAKNSILDITIRLLKQGGADKEVIKGLSDVKKTAGSLMTAFAALAGVAYTVDQVLDATAGKAVEYSNKIELVANGTGLSSEASSRLVQVTDDLRVSYDDLSASIKKNSDVTDFSVEGLAALSEQYLALTTNAEKQAFAQEHFGKQWVEFTKVLKAGPEALLAMNAAVDENLIMTAEQMQATKLYQEQMDQLNDSWEALTVGAGNEYIPVLNEMLGWVIKNQEGIILWGGSIIKAFTPLSMLFDLIKGNGEAVDATSQSYLNQVDALNEVSDTLPEAEESYKSLLDTTLNLQKGYDDFAEAQDKVAQKMAEANAQLATGEITAEEHAATMATLNAEYDKNAAAAEEWAKRTVFAMLQTRVATMEGGSEQEKFSFLVTIGEQMGVIDEETAAMAQGLNESMSSIDLSQPETFYDLWRDIIDLPHDQTFYINTVSSGEVTDPYADLGILPSYAVGGNVSGGAAVRVHEDEIFIPSSNGYVLTRQDAREIFAGQVGGSTNNSRSLHIENLTINAKASVLDVLEELS